MLHRGKPKDASSSRRKVTPPSPTYMNNEQFGSDALVQSDRPDYPTNRHPPTAAYLANLRENRVNRPGGSRPLPPSTRSRVGAAEQLTTAGRSSIAGDSIRSEPPISHQRTESGSAKPRGSRPSIAGSVTSRYSVNTASGRDYFPDTPTTAPLKPSEVVPSATYIERGQRWMEKEEAFSLHQAMDAVEIKDEAPKEEQAPDEETRLYNAALNEAAELVYRHEHGIKPREPDAPYRYRPHMRRNSYAHARTASAGRYGSGIGATGLARDSIRSFSGSSSGSDRDSSPGSERGSMDQQRNFGTGSTNQQVSTGTGGGTRLSSGSRRRSSMRRNISGEIEKPFSGDQIWEEPEAPITHERSVRQPRLPVHSQPLGLKRTSPNKIQFVVGGPRDPNVSSVTTPAKPLSQTEIHKNPPSQSNNPNYTKNNIADSSCTPQDIPRKNGVEIRSEDIRQATSMRLKDRSPKLPTPSAVSDSPGRPIVSFDKNWKAPEEAATDPTPDESRRVPFGIAEERPRPKGPQPPAPTIVRTPDIPRSAPPATESPRHSASIPSIQLDSCTTPQVPTIAISDDGGSSVPTIVLPGGDDDGHGSAKPSVPVIVTPDDMASKPSTRPLPDPRLTSRTPNAPIGGRPRGHWSPVPGASHRATAICHECRYPIEGRVVALSGGSERFHPQCFRCYTCGTSLEALEISPEPDHFYAARLDRIRRRAAGEILDEAPGQTMAEDGDERMRFFCHLDWHELFAPQCKHCKTPILGEHVVALGEHWHYGHFFCAECGDPFERGMTHIEKDGYAWCVACQTKRTERRAPKCKRCKTAVIGQYIKALGAEWHDECFRCATCGGGFDDGQIFPVGEGEHARVLCTSCRAQELKR